MTLHQRIAQITLWAFVITLGILLGAGIYETLVITPVWAGATPESVRQWNTHPLIQIHPGHFWRIFTPLNMVLALVALAAGWRATRERRRCLIVAAVGFELAVISTVFFFVPIIFELLIDNGAGLSATEITTKAERWVNLNWLRLAVIVIAWLSALRALSLPLEAKAVEHQAFESVARDLKAVELRRAGS